MTTDRADPRLHQINELTGQQKAYLVLPEVERQSNHVRPLRQTYVHVPCGHQTMMALDLAETYARNPGFYTHTFCCRCRTHFPVSEFKWANTDETVGS